MHTARAMMAVSGDDITFIFRHGDGVVLVDVFVFSMLERYVSRLASSTGTTYQQEKKGGVASSSSFSSAGFAPNQIGVDYRQTTLPLMV